jgi:flavin-dependent thymidylate synthase
VRATIIDHTGACAPSPWYAADLMIFTKTTRVEMTPGAREEIAAWPEERKRAELEYMANTIPSSWEFCDYTFLLEKVTRSLTHQLVRTRTASYAQQTMQILDVRGFTYETGKTIEENPTRKEVYRHHMFQTNDVYKWLIDDGASVEDARGVLPHAIHTNIVAKANLRTIVDLFHTRISPRNLGEFRVVCEAMRAEVLRVHPWASIFLDRTIDRVTEELDAAIRALAPDDAMRPGTEVNRMLKLIDQLRRRG